MRTAGLIMFIAAVATMTGCSKSERKRVKNFLDDVHDFHVEVAKAAVVTTAAVGTFAASNRTSSSHHSTERVERTYVVSPGVKKAMEDKERIRTFIEGYYANEANRNTFPFAVQVRDFKIRVADDITIQWWVSTAAPDAEVIFASMAAEKDRIRAALAAREYEYPQGIMMTVDIILGDDSRVQSSYRIRW